MTMVRLLLRIIFNFPLLKDFMYLLFREMGREKMRERNIDV